MFKSILKTILPGSGRLRYCSTVVTEASKPLILPLNTQIVKPKFIQPRQAWIENLDTLESQKVGLMDLHPEVFAAMPRIDLIHQNFHWQRMYRFVSMASSQNRMERSGGGRKPWPQKGLGKARHGSIRSPLWRGGGRAHGPRSPTPHFYMLGYYRRVHGLVSMLSVKLAQDDLKIVQNLNVPTDDPEYLLKLIDERLWGPSVLIVDDDDYSPRNITAATDAIPQVHICPVYGLNVYSMLKYHTLVLTVPAIEKIQDKLLFHMHRTDGNHMNRKFNLNQKS
ncbi:39S ribosomal protein L4, mitochondrial [Bradysia coprophila]|uniref:39S ribosomal protein L4, mitochondrial n=1 Tax=Bradysia coprophila TaxID=38358 RepID=UPI00187D8387|nr:39S ribosomal protein L4, mitochondrial [Bradysia coprophila]